MAVIDTIGGFRLTFRPCVKASDSVKLSYETNFIHPHILFHLPVNKTNFHINGFALGLALKQRRKATRKWAEPN